MGLLVNTAIASLASVVGIIFGNIVNSKLAPLFGLIFGVSGFFAAGALVPAQSTTGRKQESSSEWEDAQAAKAAKKARKAAAEKAKREAEAAAKAEEAAAKQAAKKKAAADAAKKAAKAGKKAAAPVVESESEPEPEVEEEEEAAPKSKSALKKAKAKAKELAAKAEAAAAAAAAAKAAEGGKKGKKKGAAKEAEPAAAAAPAAKTAAAPAKGAKDTAAAEKAAAKAAAADLEGWETIEPTKPTKAQLAKAALEAASPTGAASGKKQASIPSSERPLTIDLVVPTKQHALIIGREGATLKQLTAGSGATIDMPKRESASSKIQITGTPAQVAAAKNAIESLVERGFSSITHPGTLSDDITIDPKDVGLILGAGGVFLKTIQNETKTKINVPEKGSSSKKVTIVGEKEGVRAAKAALRQLLADGFSPLTHPGWIKQEIEFPGDKMGILIGPKGQTIKSIQGNTKTRINLPDKSAKGATTVSVCGLAPGVAQAEKEILRLLEPLAPLPEPEEIDLANDDAWGQEHTAQGEDALW